MNINDLIGPQLDRLQKNALIAAVIGLVICVIGAMLQAPQNQLHQFFASYLFGFMFWMGVTVGSLAWLMIGHVTGGGWAFMLRRPLEAATRNLPLVFAMFVPILIAAFLSQHSPHGQIFYEWANLEEVAGDRLLRAKAPYLNTPGFAIRAIIYFAIWMTFAFFLNKWSRVQDERADEAVASKLNKVSAFGLLVYVMTMTFAAIDWVMSLTPHWYSSLFGVIIIIGQGLSTLALMSLLIASLAGRTPLVLKMQQEQPRYFRDLGNLTLAFVLLWAYTNFSQFMLIWAGNIAEETIFFIPRTATSWVYIGAFLAVGHFVVPFLCLLSSSLKVKITNLSKLAAFLIFMRFVDLWWYVTPTFRQGGINLQLTDIGVPILLGGLWLWSWARQLKGRQLVPMHDPRLQEHLPLVREVMQHG